MNRSVLVSVFFWYEGATVSVNHLEDGPQGLRAAIGIDDINFMQSQCCSGFFLFFFENALPVVSVLSDNNNDN